MSPRRFVFASALVLVACVAMERIPTADEIRRSSAVQPFLVEYEELTGVYQNLDVDSLVFRYRTSSRPDAFWTALSRAAVQSGWDERLHSRTPGQRAFDRLKPKGGLGFSSAEEVRVGVRGNLVVVGYVQSDQNGERPVPVERANEGQWAQSRLWPRFASELAAPVP